jgi:hypothetical protein
LRAWLSDPNGDAVQVISGDGGLGKTRLAAEFALEMRGVKAPASASSATPNANWKAGFVSNLDDVGEERALFSDECALCVIDYPEENPKALTRWIKALAAAGENNKQLRLLLLSRHFNAVKKLFEDCNHDQLLPTRPIQLQALGETDGFEILQQSLSRLAKLGYPSVMVKPDAFKDWRQQNPLHQTPLFVLALAIQLAQTGQANLQLTGTELLDALCKREETRLNNIGEQRGVGLEHAGPDLLAWAILLDGLKSPERLALCNALLPEQAPALLKVFRANGMLSADQPTLHRLEPDLLAAWWLHRWLGRLRLGGDDEAHLLTLAQHMAKREPQRWRACLANWNRLGYDLSYRLGVNPNPIDHWAAQHTTHTWVPQHGLLINLFSEQPTWNGIPSAAVAASGMGLSVPASADEESQAGRAGQLNNLAVRLANNGQHQEALQTTQAAAGIRRRLARAKPDVYEPDWAMSLNNLANRLAKDGQHQAALQTAQEAADIYRRLVQAKPDIYEPDLAGSLNNLANRLSEDGQHQAALQTVQAAADIYRRLAQANPAAYEPYLAMSLNTLASRLSEDGQHQAALQTAQEAVDIYNRLAQANPAAYNAKLANSLATLAFIRDLP